MLLELRKLIAFLFTASHQNIIGELVGAARFAPFPRHSRPAAQARTALIAYLPPRASGLQPHLLPLDFSSCHDIDFIHRERIES